MLDSQLTPRQQKTVARLLRDRLAGETEVLSSIKRVERITLAVLILLLAAALVAVLARAPSILVWVLGFATGIACSIFANMQLRHESWPLVVQIMDWNKVQKLAEVEEK